MPVTAAQFGDARVRESFIRDKGMQVLQFWSDLHRETPVDVFVQYPFDFDETYEEAFKKPMKGVGEVRFVPIPVLIRMETANRPQDRIDVEHLKMISEDDA